MRIRELQGLNPNCWFDVKNQLRDHIYARSREAFRRGNEARDAVRTAEDLEKRRTAMRKVFLDALGGLPAGDTPLNAMVTGEVQCDGYKVEKVIFESRPGAYVTANLYIPDGITGPTGAVLFVCGHHETAKQADEYQVVCQYLVRSGLIVLAQDPVGQGERLSYYEKIIGTTTLEWGVTEHTYAGSQCWPLGDSIARYFLHDDMRGLDYLRTRPEVDPARIGVTGNSGGGLQTCMMMVADPRIAAAAPTTFLMEKEIYMESGGGQDAEQIWPGISAAGFDHEDILLCMAPRPTLVLAVKYDFFPIEGTRKTVERSRRFWELYGKGDCIDLFADDSVHHYTRTMAKKAAAFFSLHLLGKQKGEDFFTPALDQAVKPIEPSRLRCTRSGQTRGEIDGVRFVHEENKDRLQALEAARNQLPPEERREKALEWIRKKVFHERKPCELNPRHYTTLQAEDLTVEMCFWWAQEGIIGHAYTFRDYKDAGKELPVTVAVWAGGTTEIQTHIGWIRKTCQSGRAVMVLDVTGDGGLLPNPLCSAFNYNDFHGTLYKLATDFMFMGDSIAALRAYDITRALDMAACWPGLKGEDIELYGQGRFSFYVNLASAVEPGIRSYTVESGMESMAGWVGARHYDCLDIVSVILPGALKYFDIPDLEQWFGDKK